MFERYTEDARRSLFFARDETSQLGSVAIDTEHLLLGVMRSSHWAAGEILKSADCSRETLRQEIEHRSELREKVPTSREIPFSKQTQRVLNYAAEEADRLLHNYIGSEHLLLGLLREEQSVAGSLLAAHGVRLADAREIVRKANARPEASGLTFSGEASSQVDQIRALVQQLARLPSDGDEARALTDRILRALDALKRH